MVFLFYRWGGRPRVFAALAVLLTLGALFLCAPRAWSPAGRLAGPAAFAALTALPIGDYGFTANTEVFLNFFMAAAAAAVLRGAPFWAGLAAGAALAAKQTALWTVLGFGAFFADKPRRAFLYMAGALTVPLLWAAYFAARGGLGAYWDAVWSGNLRYAGVLLMTGTLAEQLRWFLTALLPQLAAYGLPALALGYHALRGGRAGKDRPVETLAVVWFGTAVSGALTGLFLFPHYFLQAAPGLALAAAAGVQRMRARRWAAVFLLAVWPALLAPRIYFFATPRENALTLMYPNPLFETLVMGEEIARRAQPGDRLHVFGSEGALFTYSGLRPATPHTLSYALTLFPKDASQWQTELARLYAAPPRFVVWSGQPLSTMISSKLGLDYRDALIRFLQQGYVYAGSVAVVATPRMPIFLGARPGARARFEDGDRLLLFERR